MKDTQTQIDFLIQNNILKQPTDVGSDMDIKTQWFNSLSKTEQDIYYLKITEQWWDEYGQHIFNDVYTDILVNDKVSGNILSEFNQYIKSEIDYLEKYIGLKDYKENIKNVKTNLLDEYIKELNLDINKKDKELVKKELVKRRHQNGGCSIWKKVAIPYLYKHHKDKLYDFEIEWYEKQK